MKPEWTILFVCEGEEGGTYTCSTEVETGVMPVDPMSYLPEETGPEDVVEWFVFAGPIQKHDITY